MSGQSICQRRCLFRKVRCGWISHTVFRSAKLTIPPVCLDSTALRFLRLGLLTASLIDSMWVLTALQRELGVQSRYLSEPVCSTNEKDTPSILRVAWHS